MKIVKKDFRHETKIMPETLDDLWNMMHILREGDIVGARTFRTVQASSEGEKKPVFLKISLEKLVYSEDGRVLRASGKIIHAPEDFEKGYHTLAIEPGTVVSVEKGWEEHELKRLKDALTYRGMNVLICVMDERRADFAHASELRVKEVASVHSKSAGKMFGGAGSEKFYADVISYIRENIGKYDKAIIAGPGFARENLFAALPQEIKRKCVLEPSSITGATGINEVIKRGALGRIMADSRLSKETQFVESFLAGLGRETGLVTYGTAQVKSAVVAGAAERVLVSDVRVREKEVQEILRAADSMRIESLIINSTHEAGEKLLSLGGIAAFLRYKFEG